MYLGFNKSLKSVARADMELLKMETMVSQYIALFHFFSALRMAKIGKLD
jgi:hypothetical protein